MFNLSAYFSNFSPFIILTLINFNHWGECGVDVILRHRFKSNQWSREIMKIYRQLNIIHNYTERISKRKAFCSISSKQRAFIVEIAIDISSGETSSIMNIINS